MNFKLSTSVIIGIGLSRMCRGLPVDAYSIREELGFANPAQLGKVWEEFLAESRIKSIQHELQFLQNLDYSNIELSEVAADSISLVCEKAKSIYGEGWNYYSNALRMEVAKGFDLAIERLSNRKTNYLEIGSCQGLSMGLIGTILKKKSLISSLVSIDPYFENGYIEGKHGPWREDLNIRVDKSTKIQAETLYRNLQLPVRIIEKKSHEGLRYLIREDKKFDLVYIDGSHEGLNPIIDFGLCMGLVSEDASIILDDHYWPDVQVLKKLCDSFLEKEYESWKIAIYRI